MERAHAERAGTGEAGQELMADVKGKMHCRTCDQRVTAVLNRNATQALSSVRYIGHTGRKGGQKVKCPNTTVQFGDRDFPGWAKKAVADLPKG